MQSEDIRPTLRDCPFCHTKGSDDENLHFMENHVVYDGGSYVASYSIFCTGCGVELHDEYRDDLARRWNGEKEQTDAE
jgi:hypothetical protein